MIIMLSESMEEPNVESNQESPAESKKLLDNIYVRIVVGVVCVLVILVSIGLIFWSSGGTSRFFNPSGDDSETDTEESTPGDTEDTVLLDDEEDDDESEGESGDAAAGADGSGAVQWVVVPPSTECDNLVDFSDGEIVFDNLEPWGTLPNSVIVTGDIPGTWSFEGQLSVFLYDEDGILLGQWAMVLEDDWMTEELVPFSVPLVFDPGDSSAGTVVIEAANPSDLEENCREMHVQVTF